MSTVDRPRPSIRIFFIVLGGLASGASAGGGVGASLYPPVVGVALAVAAGALTGVGVWRARRRARKPVEEG